MSVDLRSNTMFSRVSVVLIRDSLVLLEHGRTQDRMRRMMLDSIASVVIWRRVPWVRIIVCAVFLLGPGIALLFVGQTFATVMGIILGALGALLIAWYAYCRSTMIRITRGGGKVQSVVGIFRPSKVARLRDRLIAAINAAQAAPAPVAPAVAPEVATAPAVPSPGPDGGTPPEVGPGPIDAGDAVGTAG